jgi:hypothetical protein
MKKKKNSGPYNYVDLHEIVLIRNILEVIDYNNYLFYQV